MAEGDDDESWFKTKDAATTDHRDSISVRMTNFAQDTAAKRSYAADIGEDDRWFPRGSRQKQGEAQAADGATHRAQGRPNLRRSQSKLLDQAAVVLCCCGGSRWSRKYETVEAKSPEEVLRTKGRWEVDADDEFFKPPVWKQIILKVRKQARQVNCGSGGNNSGHWVNYDAQSYEKNFDNGSWRDTSRDVYQENDGDEKLGLKERALHTAFLQKLASTRSQKLSDGEIQMMSSSNSPGLSPLPVRSPPNTEFVPIWQRRASSPVTLDVRQR